MHIAVTGLLGENLRDKDRNGTGHNQCLGPCKKGISKTDSV